MYIAIDGDDSGKKIAACYINNDEAKLGQISKDLERTATRISELLRSKGFRIIFCAADGVAAATNLQEVSVGELFDTIRRLTPNGFTISAGVGNNLHEAYIALLNAKSLGKDRFSSFSDIKR